MLTAKAEEAAPPQEVPAKKHEESPMGRGRISHSGGRTRGQVWKWAKRSLKYKFLKGVNLSSPVEKLENPRAKSDWDPILVFICSPKHRLWRRNFLTENNHSDFSVIIVLNEKNEVCMPHKTIPPQYKIHKCIKSRTTSPFLADFSREHDNGSPNHFSNTSASPSWPTGFNLPRGKTMSKFNLLMSTATQQCLPFPGRAGSLDTSSKWLSIKGKFFCLRKSTREVEGDLLKAPHPSQTGLKSFTTGVGK